MLCVVVAMTTFSCSYETTRTEAEEGVVKIGDIEERLLSPLIDIFGEWEFYKNEFYFPGDFPKAKAFVKMPHTFKGKGYGTYRIELIQQLDENGRSNNVLILEYIKSSARIFINGELTLEIGQVGKSRQAYQPEGGIDFIRLPDTKRVEIVIHVANYYHEMTGINKVVKISTYQGFLNFKEMRISFRIAVGAALAALIINLFVMAVFLKEKTITLWFATQFVIILMFNILYIPGVNVIDKGLNEEFNIRLLVLIAFVNPLIWIKIFKKLFRRYCPEIAVKIMTYVFLVFCLMGVTLDLEYLYQTVEVFQIAVYTTIIFFLYVNVKAIIAGYPVARWYLGAILFILFSFMFDVMVYAGIVSSRISMIPISSLMFILMVTAGTFREYAKAFTEVEEQGVELSKRVIEVEELNTQIKKAIEIKDEFLRTTSHEMKAPLNGIIDMTEMMIEGESGLMSQAAMNQLAIIGYSSRRLNNMISNVVEASNIELGDSEISLSPVNVSGVLEVVKKLAEKELKKASIEMEIDVGEDISVLGDEYRLNQIFSNIVNNAIRHSGATIIRASIRHEGEKVIEIAIEDNGTGISDAQRDGIFKKKLSYNRLDGRYSGLGLYISSELCKRQDGHLFSEKSRTFGGAMFIVSLKRSETVAKKGIAEYLSYEEQLLLYDDKEISENGKESKKISTVWVVDDDTSSLRIMEKLLSRYNVKTYTDPRQVLEDIRYSKPNLILLDIMMPSVDGYEVCREIRKIYNYSEMPIIFLTGKSTTDEIVKGFDVGGNDYMVKPITKDLIRARVKIQLALALMYRRWVSLRRFSNQISEFKSMKDMVRAIFELLKEEESIEDIIVYDSGVITKRVKEKERKIAFEKIKSSMRKARLEVQNIEIDEKQYTLLDITGTADIMILVEYFNEPEAIDIEYLKSAVDQIKATKNNITNLLKRNRDIEAISRINTKLKSIRYIESSGNFVDIRYKKANAKQFETDTIKTSLNTIVLYLGEEKLVRLHRRYIINLKYIRMMWKSRLDMEIDVDGDIIPIGRTYIARAEEIAEENDIEIVAVN